jgi:hypothetical protein
MQGMLQHVSFSFLNLGLWIMVFSATFNNISVISWWSVLLPLLCMFCFLLFCYSIITTFLNKVDHRVSVNGEITHVIFHKWRNNTCAPPYPVLYVLRNNTCEHSCPEKISHASLHIRRDITHAIFHVLNSCSKVLLVPCILF